jgi:TetR/AcrR family transcriptional regulator of autoinduction and epiphytic fitness
MPRTRVDVGYDDKRAQILGAAERRLSADGYAGLSVVALARELGVAQNTIHWYFPTKDLLLLAVLQQRVGHVLAAKPPAAASWTNQIIWFANQLAKNQRLITAMNERAGVTTVVATFRRHFGDELAKLLRGALAPHVEASVIEDAVVLVLSAVDGLMLRRDADRRRALQLLLDRLATT